jgi:hypothetical protein
MTPLARIRGAIDRMEPRHGLGLQLDHKRGAGYRLTRKNGTRELSPRLSAADLWRWLDGFETAMDLAQCIGVPGWLYTKADPKL